MIPSAYSRRVETFIVPAGSGSNAVGVAARTNNSATTSSLRSGSRRMAPTAACSPMDSRVMWSPTRPSRVHASWLCGAVERSREQVPLPLPWIPVQQPGQVTGPCSRRR
uniref:Uncharacterized protein n=1 Tax=Triticum urartu TaxID=4572 RepID=A0A8R7QVG9_TRIUA